MPEKLLILDDESLILKSLRNLFEDDYDVFTASDAETALGLARDHDMAVILSDERMPGISGHDFLRRAKEVSGATRLMMSGFADMSALADAVNRGQIFAYITKPWEPVKLMAQVRTAVVHFKLTQEVEHERALLRALMENIPDLIFFKDRESRFTRVNEAYARNLGAKDPQECIGKSNADYFERSAALRWRHQEEEIIRTGKPQLDLIQEVRNDREGVGWWSTTKVPMFDRNGQVSGIAGISRNITSLKKSEGLLREQSERNRMIIETAYDAFIGMDAEGSIIAWNPESELAFGWTAAEVMGRCWSDVVIPPEFRHLHALGIEHFLAGAKRSLLTARIELQALHRDGHEFPAEATIWPVLTGEVRSFNAFVRDISEQRNAEEFRRKEMTLVELLQSVTVAANQSSVLSNAAQICLDRICAYTGWAVGHAYLRASDPSDHLTWSGIWHDGGDTRFEAFRAASDRVLSLKGQELRTRVLTTGEPQWAVNLDDEDLRSERTAAAVEAGLRSGFGFPVFVEEEIVGVLEFFSLQTIPPDEKLLNIMGQISLQLGQVVIRQRIEADLQRAKTSAESANSAKGEFLTTMSHEMRTPMNVILGMADMLSESSLNEKQREYIRISQNAGASLLGLINDILDLSKVESGQVKLESIGFDLAAFLQGIIDMMSPRAVARSLKLTLEVQPEVRSGLVGDSNRLHQILINLVGNALKFTERGSVTIRVEPDPGGELDWLRFSVTDTGIGIPPGQTEMIFERFAQADSSTTRKYGGSGLGLAISKGLVEWMGGRIGCISEVGKGSTFFISVPLATWNGESSKPVEPAVTMIAPASGSGGQPAYRILIAEDSEFNLLLLRAYLEDSGFEIDFAANGKIAVEKVLANCPDLVIMDMQMPVMDGLEATRAIRQWEAKNKSTPIPILALTAHAAEAEGAKSLQAGCSEHLTKPIRKATLVEAIARHLGGKISITPPKGIEFLIPEYLASTRRDMGEILARLDAQDCDTVRRLGHQFKGSGAGYGFPQITRTGEAVELAAMASNGDEVRKQILALTRYLDRVEIAA